MNRIQRIIIWIGILVAVAMFLYPPVGTVETYGRSSPRGYAFQFGPMYGRVIDYFRLFAQFGILVAVTFVLVQQKAGFVEERPLSPSRKLGLTIVSLIVLFGFGGTFLSNNYTQIQESARKNAESARRIEKEAALKEEIAKQEAQELATLLEPRDLSSFTFGKNVEITCQTRYEAGFAEMKVIVKTAPRLNALIGNNRYRLYAVFEDVQGFKLADSYFNLSEGITKRIDDQECLQFNGSEPMSVEKYKRLVDWNPNFR